MLLNCGGEDSWEPLGLQGDQTTPSYRKTVLSIHWKDWSWSWNSNVSAIWWEELTHWKRPWCWERLKAGGEGDDRGWDGWMASPTWWTWVWVGSLVMDREAWHVAIHWVAKSSTWLSDWTELTLKDDSMSLILVKRSLRLWEVNCVLFLGTLSYVSIGQSSPSLSLSFLQGC